tara:strand:- start:459 stop:1325 length:867 start_codon:yes stop_codon:yes gene_type:complete
MYSKIIKNITPVYNKYLTQKNLLKPYQSMEIMWELGEILSNYIEELNIKPYSLFRKVYGKSEGSKNTTQNSYITKEFQAKSWRIYNIFKKKSDIKREFENLSNFNLFRESMPFFDNQKHILFGKERKDLIDLLNSTNSRIYILRKIQQLQKEKINISNPRNQRLKDLKKEEEIFIKFYNHCYNLLKQNNFNEVSKNINIKLYSSFSENTSALRFDGVQHFDFVIPKKITEIEKNYGLLLKFFSNKKTPKELRRFRRLIPINKMSKLSDMINALTNEENYNRISKLINK